MRPAAGCLLLSKPVHWGPAQTGSLPLNPSPWICQPQERHWHIKIMKLNTSATQEFRFFSCFKHLTFPNCSLQFPSLNQIPCPLGDP